MKRLFSILAPASLAVLAFGACDSKVSASDVKNAAGDAVESAKDAVSNLKDIDLAELTPDALKELSPEKLKEKMGGLSEGIATKLSEVKDAATAENAAKMLEPIVDKLASAKEMLGDKMPDMAGLKDAASNFMTKFADNEGIMGALKGVLDKIMAMFQ